MKVKTFHKSKILYVSLLKLLKPNLAVIECFFWYYKKQKTKQTISSLSEQFCVVLMPAFIVYLLFAQRLDTQINALRRYWLCTYMIAFQYFLIS